MPSKGAQRPKGKSVVKPAPPAKAGPTWTAPKTITHPEHHHTLNHLNQVAAYYAVLSSTFDFSSSSYASTSALHLQSEITRSAKTLSRKSVIRLDTSVKRRACGRCEAVMIEGLTMSIRNKASGPHDHVSKKKCGVCGAVVRQPAPDLVPEIGVGKGPRDGQKEQEEGTSEAAKGKQKVSQRQRRRTGSIKRHLLGKIKAKDDGEEEGSSSVQSAQEPSKPKLSRRQRQHARSDKSSIRLSSRRLDRFMEPSHSTKERRRNGELKPAATEPPKGPPELATTAVSSSGASIESQPTPHRKGRIRRPQLEHFNDRVQGSCWDEAFIKLSSHLLEPVETLDGSERGAETSAMENEERQVSTQALEYWEKAARSRGDHLLVTGVGKNGSLGAGVR
ncbi:hypothetical protein NDA17_007762 [Ustilago hordei]|nr:hypothetical protein NDA17_007762 [Ustilago hordei]